MPTSDKNSQAAPKPTASAMGGVPASKRAGGAAYVVTPSSRNTSPIISPPPCHGRISSNRFERPHKTPMPVGPHILWPLNATKSTPSFWTSSGLCGALWHASRRIMASGATCRTFSTTCCTGATQPNTLDTWHSATTFV